MVANLIEWIFPTWRAAFGHYQFGGARQNFFLVRRSRAFYWKSLLDTGVMKSGSEIAKNEGLHHSVVNELMRLTLLAPDIITQLMSGTQPRRLNLMWFQRNRLPVDWQAQRAIIDGFK